MYVTIVCAFYFPDSVVSCGLLFTSTVQISIQSLFNLSRSCPNEKMCQCPTETTKTKSERTGMFTCQNKLFIVIRSCLATLCQQRTGISNINSVDMGLFIFF